MDDTLSDLREAVALPLPDHPSLLGCEGYFDPWRFFPLLYGTYSSEFDECAIDILSELAAGTTGREDLAAEMFREMFCNLGWCEYGTSPRVCFPTEAFSAVLPELLARWKAYAEMQWDS